MKLETERLILREMNRDDFDAMNRVLGDAENMKHYPHPFDEEKVRNWIDRNMARYEIFDFGLMAVCLKETGELIGDCGLTMQLIGGVIKPEVGFHIRRDMQRRGYAREAAAAIRDWTFRNTPFRMLYCYQKYTNAGSRNTALSIGMKQVDEFADEVNEITTVYAMTRPEWEQLTGEIG